MPNGIHNIHNPLGVKYTAQKMKFSIKGFILDLVTFTEEILNGKLHFLCSDI